MAKCQSCNIDIEEGQFCENCAFNYWVNVTKLGNPEWFARLRKIVIDDFLQTEIQPLLNKEVKERTSVDWKKGVILRELIDKVNDN